MSNEQKPKKLRLLSKKQFKKEFEFDPDTKCEGCGDTAYDIYKAWHKDNPDDRPSLCYDVNDGCTTKSGGWACFPCKEADDDYRNTVYVFYPEKKLVESYEVGSYEDIGGSVDVERGESLKHAMERIGFDGLEDCPIQFDYVHTDAWRGYYTPKGKGWVEFHEDCILAWSKDEKELEKFDVDAKELLWGLGITFAVCISRTSNLFSQGYDIMVCVDGTSDNGEALLKSLNAMSGLMKLKAKYRDDASFTMTALTGKSDGFNKGDELIASAWNRMKAGEDGEKVVADIKCKIEAGEVS